MHNFIPNMHGWEKKFKALVWIFAAMNVLFFVGGSAAHAATSGDAYVNFDSVNRIWTLGTDAVEKKLQLDANGHFILTSLENKLTNREYLQGGSTGEEFSIKINGTTYTGNNTAWIYDTYTTGILSQGELQLSIIFHNSIVQVTRQYVIYPDTGVIQEWTDYKNISGSSMSFSDPTILRVTDIMSNDKNNVDFSYMTGGGNFTGSFILKTADMSGNSYSRTFDSQDAPEVQTVEGQYQNYSDGQNTASYNEFYALRNRSLNEGLFIAFDYFGRWSFDVNNSSGISINGHAQLDSKSVSDQAAMSTPKSMTGVFSGDLDEMGNTILYYVYKYKWDYTRDTYLGESFTKQWVNGSQKEAFFNQVGIARYIGVEAVHVDDSWYDKKGDWNNVSGDNFNDFNQYAQKSNLNLQIWMPTWHADPGSAVLTNNPGWDAGDTGWYGHALDNSINSTIQWQRNLFTSKQSQWGNFLMKNDGFPVFPVDGDSPAAYDQSMNWLELLKDFKDDNPNAGLYGCSSGGGNISIEQSRYMDVQGLTDGWALHYTNYWVTLFTPPVKSDAMNVDTNSGVTPAGMERLRKSVLLTNYIKSKGVDVKWSKVYRPTLSTGDQTFFQQRMSGDNNYGYIYVLGQSGLKGSNFTVYPKGLIDNTNYTVSSLNGSVAGSPITHTGSWWKANGITITNLQDNSSSSWERSEYIFFNMEDRPGKGSDTTAPTAPSDVSQSPATYLGHAGTQVTWTEGSDNKVVAYYEIFKNGVSYSKVSKGTFFFDSGATNSNIYQVRSVDGDGNVSETVSDQYALASDFSSIQGQENWYYMQWDGSSYTNMTWNNVTSEWEGTYTFNHVWSPDFMHPDTNDTVVAWKAPQTGTVDISGYVRKQNIAGGDGVRVKIMKNSTQIWPASGWQTIAYNDSTGYNAAVTVTVSANDMIYFIVNQNGNNYHDGTQWDPVIYYVPTRYALADDFTSTQGQKNWYYMQWDGSSYTNMTWNNATSEWEGTYTFNVIRSPDFMHPDINDTVVAWKAPQTGTVDISGYVRKQNIAGGDGVRVKIMKNSTQIWPASGWQTIAYNDSTGYNAAATVTVSANDMIYFIVNQNGNNYHDGTQWDPVIYYVPTRYALASDFSSTQGQKNWYYMQWDGSSYTNMAWNNVTSEWEGTYTFNAIRSPDFMHPDTNDTVVAWKAPWAGTVDISGYVRKQNIAGGDGVRVKIMKNSTQIWPASGWQTIAYNDSAGYNATATVTVSANDMIYFIVNQNGNNYYDGTLWDPVILYQ